MTGLLSGLGCGKLCGKLLPGVLRAGNVCRQGFRRKQRGFPIADHAREFCRVVRIRMQTRYGGINCAEIVQDDARLRMTRCQSIVMESLEKLREILADHDYEFSQQPHSVWEPAPGSQRSFLLLDTRHAWGSLSPCCGWVIAW